MGKKQTYLKYLATTSGLFFLSTLLVKYFDFKKGVFNGNTTGLLVTEIILFLIGGLLLGFYWFVKFYDLKKEKEYIMNKKEKIYFMSALGLYTLSFLLTMIFIIVAHSMAEITVLFFVMLVFILLGLIVGSVFEMISRLGYQSHMARKEYEESQILKKERIKKMISEDNTITEDEAKMIVNTNKKRTKEAEQLLKADIVKKKKEKDTNPFKD
ncbi:hypothetical protein CG007_01720 [Mesoplasma entomophilum]|uniref:hypothetical protein n=1 Tax=Mesoplasma TaxID=46239 RepID=UPI000D02CF11|nr:MULTISPECIES: hypothetical protein [Mesoplasma]AVN60334.1 hypothetical protein CG007_01720 [Mesoplasma entomophilum]AVN62351.1 hypothetical protein CG001_01670 [Mesoplasma coleopterae]AVN63039.1 hypothetical protein CG000_01830 [Mesoplasma coleopterae]